MEDTLIQITNYLLTQSWQVAVLVVVVAILNLALRAIFPGRVNMPDPGDPSNV